VSARDSALVADALDLALGYVAVEANATPGRAGVAAGPEDSPNGSLNSDAKLALLIPGAAIRQNVAQSAMG
jgi:hypothetical protein